MNSFLKIYFESNLLLLASFLLFKLTLSTVRQSGYQLFVRIAQLLILISILSPVALHFMPDQSLPAIHFKILDNEHEVSPAKRAELYREKHRAYIKSENAKIAAAQNPNLQDRILIFAKERGVYWILFAFIFGFVIFSYRLYKNISEIKELIRNAILIRKIGKVVVSVSDSAAVPFSILIAREAHVVLPARLVSSAQDFKTAIYHELQHHRSRDTSWALVIEVLVCLFYFNPAIYFWKNAIIEIQEFSNDEALIGRRKVSSYDYGSCLLRVAEAALGSRKMQVGTTCMAAALKNPKYFKSFLRRRIEMFRHHEKSRRRNLVGIALGTFSLVTTFAVAYGAQQVARPVAQTAPNPGKAIFDPVIQKMSEKILQEYVAKFKAKGGFVLVSDPSTGRLLAAANVSDEPSLKNKNWALAFQLEPASAMKGIITASAIDKSLIQPDQEFNCENGSYLYGHHLYHDWKPFDHLTVAETIAQSSNICSIKIGQRLGTSRIAATMLDFGFGPDGSGKDFPEAVPGEIPDYSQYPLEDYIAVISSGNTAIPGFRVTPLEMVQAYSVIANQGKLMKPLNGSEPDSSITMIRQAISLASADEMKVILAKAVTEGTGKNARSKLYTTAGKTSTAFDPQTHDHDLVGGERKIAGFVGFAPTGSPRLVIYAGIIDPTNSKDKKPHGNEHAAPVFRQVAEEVLQYLQVPSDK